MTAHQPAAKSPLIHAPAAAHATTGAAAGGGGGKEGAARLHPGSISAPHRPARDPLVDLIFQRRFAGQPECARLVCGFGSPPPTPSYASARQESAAPTPPVVDCLFLGGGGAADPHLPDDVFDRLRWGGQVVFVSRDRREVEATANAFAHWRIEESQPGAWVIEQSPAIEQKYLFNLRILGWRTPVHYMIARKVMLIPPGKSSDRFTYHVYLERDAQAGHYHVVKEVPSVERVLARLREKFPEADEDSLRRRARKFTDKIFPVFLTRETAMLKLLQRDLPRKFRSRVPRVISADTDDAGYVRRLRLNWLRNVRPDEAVCHAQGRAPEHASRKNLALQSNIASTAPQIENQKSKIKNSPAPLSQLEFARQSAELLAALHDDAGVMHLDLRLDNFVITEHGVGFVDFGSSVRVGEEFPEASLLSNLFDEMMRTSQIQRMLGKMTESGQVTSQEILSRHQRIDKAADFFYLAVQINAPHANPDFRGLVEHDPESKEAHELSKLTEQILRPTGTQKTRFTSAKDILRGIESIAKHLGKTEPAA